ncbi:MULTISPECIES: transcription termination factor NusA [Helicobacter]|uniref:Transcription termination/antitermination protein NusA n=5 Tax=Helicobacter typhlonius TaxID=76936 RepID=A0A099UG12_9HELI|nr:MULTISPECIES: transcription termination factor NusA [Helicobacter]TLD78780.1 transcription termination/antitermination protein NusA [Helicobacter typhlonius]TLD90115.1 transcription termination/antitermination protein NusA [Helicobacter sp. MIT 03-1616]CUU40769.1 Transcription termination protein NusA [Helicobacter typhlonius]HCD72771.1 transcription termination/antitermination protein NusA [Helicobacter sp.]
MEKILDIIDLIAYEKGLEHKVVLDIVKDGLIKIAQDEINPLYDYFVEEDSKERTLKLFYRMKVCADNEVLNEEQKARMMPLSVAKKELGDVSVNDEIDCELQLDSMSRGAINKLFLNLEYNLQRSIEDQILQNFRAQLGKIVSGQVVGVDSLGNTFVEIDSIRAVLPQKNRIKGESFKVGDTIRAILKFVGINRNGLQVELSRTTPKFLEELLALEVPEVKDNEVMIHKSARIPGERAKVAVYSHNPRIDPIGCCVGVKGVRINAVSKELANENIDCVEYHNSLEIFVAKALTPAQILSVKIQEPQKDDKNIESTQDSKENQNNEKAPETKRKKAIAQIKTDQKSKAIGKNGVNIRLASMLCECDIELQEITESKPTESEKVGIDALSSLFKS